MNKVGYTSGPWNEVYHEDWSVEYDGGSCSWGYIAGDDGSMITLPVTLGRYDNKQFDANVKLISAAPDLLKALKMFMDDYNHMDDEWIAQELNAGNAMMLTILSAKAAIAKATGQQS